MDVVYFSTKSENTKRFVDKVTENAKRIPISSDSELKVDSDYVLVFPTYGGGYLNGAVPKPVIRFLNDETNRGHLKGVVGCGNTNFGDAYCLGSYVVAKKCDVPVIRNVEIMGTPEDVRFLSTYLEYRK